MRELLVTLPSSPPPPARASVLPQFNWNWNANLSSGGPCSVPLAVAIQKRPSKVLKNSTKKWIDDENIHLHSKFEDD
jgi:hypothetical protein